MKQKIIEESMWRQGVAMMTTIQGNIFWGDKAQITLQTNVEITDRTETSKSGHTSEKPKRTSRKMTENCKLNKKKVQRQKKKKNVHCYTIPQIAAKFPPNARSNWYTCCVCAHALAPVHRRVVTAVYLQYSYYLARACELVRKSKNVWQGSGLASWLANKRVSCLICHVWRQFFRNNVSHPIRGQVTLRSSSGHQITTVSYEYYL